jgi:uncharacterized membrane protein (DUF2068 family)
VIATGLFIPFEAIEVLHMVTTLRVAAAVVNMAIVVHLAYRKKLLVSV